MQRLFVICRWNGWLHSRNLTVKHFVLLMLLVLAALVLAQGCGFGRDKEQARKVIEWNAYPMPPMWSSDQMHVVFNADERMHVVTADGSNLFTFPHAGSLSLEHAGSISPNHNVVAFTEHRFGRGFSSNPSRYNIETALLDGSERRNLTEDHPIPAFYPAWSPDGSQIAFLSEVFPPGNYDRRGFFAIHTVKNDGSDFRFIDWDPNVWHNGDQDTSQEIGKEPLVWSPDGRYIAFLGFDCSARQSRLADCPDVVFVFDIENGLEPVRLSETASLSAWSPDSSRIAFIQNKDGAETIATIRPDGSDLREIVSIPQATSAYPVVHVGGQRFGGWILNEEYHRGRWLSWSRDGSEIRVQRSPFIVVNVDGSDLRVMWAEYGAQAAWSPDDSRIAVSLAESPTGVKLFTMARDGSDKRILVRWDEAANNRWEAAGGRTALGGPGWTWTQSHVPEVSESG